MTTTYDTVASLIRIDQIGWWDNASGQMGGMRSLPWAIRGAIAGNMDPAEFNELLCEIADTIGPAIAAIESPAPRGHEFTKSLCGALMASVPVLVSRFGEPVVGRYPGCPPSYDRYTESGRQFRTLGYLWDFCISRYSIPQAIEQDTQNPIGDGKFEMLMVAESELGTSTEVCRDLLKLLLAPSIVRCLIYNAGNNDGEFQKRMHRVMRNYEHFSQATTGWLFVPLRWAHRRPTCEFFTLDQDAVALVPLTRIAPN